MRYRLIPTRGTGHRSEILSTEDPDRLKHFAAAFAADLGQPVLVTSHPVGGRTRVLYTEDGSSISDLPNTFAS